MFAAALLGFKHKTHASKRWFLVSITSHIAIIGFIIYLGEINGSNEISDINIEDRQVKSYLFIRPQKEQLNQAIADNELIDETIKEINLSQSEKLSVTTKHSPTLDPTDNNTENLTANVNKVNKTSLINEAASLKVSKNSNSRLVSKINEAVSQINLSKVNALAHQKTRDYIASKNSVDIDTQLSRRVIESKQQIKTKKVDCSSLTKKSIAILSGMLRGTIVCNDSPSLTPFIEKHKKN